MDLKKLRDPFPEDCIEWRIKSSGLDNDGKPWATVLAYLTVRAIEDRLDEVVGQENWQNKFTAGPVGGMLCGIGIKVGSEWIWKFDGADIPEREPVKGCFSDSQKRAAVQWGIGRYLYGLPGMTADVSATVQRKSEGWRKAVDKGKNGAQDRVYYWRPPQLPAAFLPARADSPHLEPTDSPRTGHRNGRAVRQ